MQFLLSKYSQNENQIKQILKRFQMMDSKSFIIVIDKLITINTIEGILWNLKKMNSLKNIFCRPSLARLKFCNLIEISKTMYRPLIFHNISLIKDNKNKLIHTLMTFFKFQRKAMKKIQIRRKGIMILKLLRMIQRLNCNPSQIWVSIESKIGCIIK